MIIKTKFYFNRYRIKRLVKIVGTFTYFLARCLYTLLIILYNHTFVLIIQLYYPIR